MKKHTTTLIILLFAAAAYGQKVEFEYDKAGDKDSANLTGSFDYIIQTSLHTSMAGAPKDWHPDDHNVFKYSGFSKKAQIISYKSVLYAAKEIK